MKLNGKRQKILGITGLVLLLWFWLSLPSQLFTTPTSFVITDSSGNLLNASIAADGQWRFPYDTAVPQKFADCITTYEDKRFFYHPGVDVLALSRAIKQNLQNTKTVSGGSTLTMQVMRLSTGHRKRNLWNKLKEALLAVRLECSYRKHSILALYASNAPFGSNVVGLDAAAWRYYGRSPQQLSWGEMAALAVLPNAPAAIHPGKNREQLLRKRNDLLNKLYHAKKIDSTTCALAQQEPLPGEPHALPQLAPHLLDRFKKEYTQLHKQDKALATGIATTLQMNLQQQVNDIIARHQAILKGNQVNNAAAMVVEIETGNIVAYTGNIYNPADASLESHVDVLNAPRSPGSTLKPILYAASLTDGSLLPRQLVPDVPTQINGYTPQNFDLGYDGAVPANRALARSLNIPAIKLLQQYKYPRLYNVLKQCGLTTLNRPADFYGMSLILGGCEVTPYELAGVYSSMARMYLHERSNKGKWNSDDWFMPRYISGKSGAQNEKSKKEQAAAHTQLTTANSQLFTYPSLWHTFNAMTEVMRPGEEGLWGLFGSAQRVAWKTGTSFGFRDGWAVGFTTRYCVVVWVGNTSGEGRPGLTGITAAAPILFDIFRLLPLTNWFESPTTGFTYLPVCHQSGFKAGTDCENRDTVLVDKSAVNAPVCPYHKIIHLDKTGNYRVTANCVSPADMQHVSWFVLPPGMEYYYRQQHTDYKTLPPFMQGCEGDNGKILDVIYPEEYSKIYVPLEVSGQRGSTVFRATHRDNNIKLFWHIDNHYITTTQHFHQVAVAPTPGKHVLTVIDENGESVTRNFTVQGKD
ncbi:penicillin-binding protein 1C [Filimonas lacunae]|uniref:peptidoglycan glycosyltransferase n=1 Tax=Filimonas lacunae TaxID=477680 RepID=A0A173M9J7_9BACT|nr:penicillin-binding protein 1C [Filimonas lacunae]BAV04216.1 multimodular transpeptidase-transglycosylase [Filimonas lacunae]SIT14072.1 penicillin-binding protein 1C [Filimonas lacunae]